MTLTISAYDGEADNRSAELARIHAEMLRAFRTDTNAIRTSLRFYNDASDCVDVPSVLIRYIDRIADTSETTASALDEAARRWRENAATHYQRTTGWRAWFHAGKHLAQIFLIIFAAVAAAGWFLSGLETRRCDGSLDRTSTTATPPTADPAARTIPPVEMTDGHR